MARRTAPHCITLAIFMRLVAWVRRSRRKCLAHCLNVSAFASARRTGLHCGNQAAQSSGADVFRSPVWAGKHGVRMCAYAMIFFFATLKVVRTTVRWCTRGRPHAILTRNRPQSNEDLYQFSTSFGKRFTLRGMKRTVVCRLVIPHYAVIHIISHKNN